MAVVSSEAWLEKACFPNPMVCRQRSVHRMLSDWVYEPELPWSLATQGIQSDCFILQSSGAGDGRVFLKKSVLQSYVGLIMEVISCHFCHILLGESQRSSPPPTRHTEWEEITQGVTSRRWEHRDHIRVCPHCVIKVKSSRNQMGAYLCDFYYLIIFYHMIFYIFLCLHGVCF